MNGAVITPADYAAARLVVERSEGCWTVPSISEQIPGGDPVLRVVRATGDRRGVLSFECDCPHGFLGKGQCRHVRAVVAWLRIRHRKSA